MTKLNRSFLKGRMNKDVDERIMEDGDYKDARNIDIVHSEGSDAGTVRNKLGNTKIQDLSNVAGIPTDSSVKTIGAVISETDNLIYWLVAGDKFDGVYEYSETTGNIVRVLQSNKATPTTPSKLNFNQDYFVTGINFLEGMLFWTDNYNPPRRINISRAKSYAIDDEKIDLDISVILAAPLNPPVIEMFKEQTNITNIEDKFIQFSVRYKYKDDQYSAMSPFSATAFIPGTFYYDYGVGDNMSMLNSNNRINVQFSTGNSEVVEIQLLYRDSSSNNVYIVDSFDKEKLDIDSDSIYSHDFSNNKIYKTLSTKQLFRLYDNVPIKAKAQEVIGRRIVYGNYTQGYDITNTLGDRILIDYTVDYTQKGTDLDTPIQTFRSDRDYEVGIIYGDDYGRFSTVLTSLTNTVNIPPSASATGNNLQVSINNEAPDFATNYRVVVKQSKYSYYTIFPVLYYSDGGLYRYFKINESDIDKVSINEYVIFKSDFNGPTYSNKKYKVLDIKSYGASGITGGSLSGLYFKIRVDDISEFTAAQLVDHMSAGVALLPIDFGLSSIPIPSSGIGWTNSYGLSREIIQNIFSVAENPIHYGTGEAQALTVVGNTYTGSSDKRYTIEVTGDYEFKWTENTLAQGGWSTSLTAGATPISIGDISLSWNITEPLTVGDRWKINCRTNVGLGGGVLGGQGLPIYGTKVRERFDFYFGASYNIMNWFGAAVIPNADWVEDQNVDVPIEAGAVVTIVASWMAAFDINYSNDQFIVLDASPSPRRYENIEEWFFESGALNDWNDSAGAIGIGSSVNGWHFDLSGVSFRRAREESNGTFNQGSNINQYSLAYPMRMICNIQPRDYTVGDTVQIYDSNTISIPSRWNLTIRITQAESFAICETTAKDSESDIFYETSSTYKIEDGLHKTLWYYDDFTEKDGYTVLGQETPGTSPSEIDRHSFTLNDEIWVESTTINGVYKVTEVIDFYNVVIDLVYPGGGIESGSATFYQTDINGIPIINRDQNSTLTMPAVINVNQTQDLNSTYNAYAFGNGAESYRIRDSFNSTEMQYSPRATIAIEDYKREYKESSLTYSGVFKSDSSVNRLNEFNLSDSNFKNLDMEFGSIQKLHALNTNLTVFQEDKISKVLYGKNLLSDSSGGGTITSIPEVLGTQIAQKGEWGISFNPESFSVWGTDMFFTDSRRGSVLMMRGDEIVNISNSGMKDYFKDLMREDVNTKKIGVYSPYNNLYILASDTDTSLPCSLSINRTEKSYPSKIVGSVDVSSKDKIDYTITSNSSWTASINYVDGSGWVSNFPTSGEGDRDVKLNISNNTSGATRVAIITIAYCDGKTVTFTITQARSKKLNVVSWVSNKK